MNNQDNSLLVSINGPKMPDIMKEMSKERGINSDLDIAMENARFLDTNLLIGGGKNTTVTPEQMPKSPKGKFRTKLHGI